MKKKKVYIIASMIAISAFTACGKNNNIHDLEETIQKINQMKEEQAAKEQISDITEGVKDPEETAELDNSEKDNTKEDTSNENSNLENQNKDDGKEVGNPKSDDVTTKENEKTKETEDSKKQEEEKDKKNDEKSEESNFSFKDISNLAFWHGSGVGAWCTELTIDEHGKFKGSYHDTDYDVTYYCGFSGQFTKPERVNDLTYKVQIKKIKLDNKPETEEETEDGMRFVYTEPYGINDAKDFYIYLPGSARKDLPEGFNSWMSYNDEVWDKDNKLKCYGFYNENTQDGFSSYEVVESAIDFELEEVNQRANKLNDELESGDLPQQEMNQKSYEIYQIWDDELNSIWKRITNILDEDAMDKLREEEREWIQYKEEEVKAAGAECEGGTLQPLLENSKAIELTRDRVYELAAYLR